MDPGELRPRRGYYTDDVIAFLNPLEPDVTHRSLLFVALLTASACGVTEPEGLLIVRGTVVAAADGAGFVQGQPIDNVQMTLRYTAPLTLSVAVRDDDLTDVAGAYELRSGPPPGQLDPDCNTLTVVALKTGFNTEQVRLSSSCGQGSATVEDLVIELTPS